MLDRLASLAAAAPRRVLAVAALLLVVGALLGAPVASHLKSGGFTVADAESTTADASLEHAFHGGTPNLIVLIGDPDGANSSAARAAGTKVASILHHTSGIDSVQSYWDAPKGVPALRSKDGDSALVLAHITGDDDTVQTRAGDVADALPTSYRGASIRLGGSATTYDQVNVQTPKDLERAEMISIPITAIALILVFGSVVAALVPLAIGVFSIVLTLAVLRGLAGITDVSIYAMNMTTALGLALAIDYSLFIVSRYREELARGRERMPAIRTAAMTAGRTVLFSAVTVALSLAALAVFPMYFLRSFAYAGIAVVALAVLSSMIVTPALLAVIGPRINSLDLRALGRRILRRPEPAPKAEERRAWYRLAQGVMRRPVLLGGAVVIILVLLGLPFLRAQFGYPDDRVLTTAQSSRQVGDVLRTDFALDAGSTLTGVAPATTGGAPEVAAYAKTLSSIPNVADVTSSAGTYAHGRRVGPAPSDYAAHGAERFDVDSTVDPFSSAGTQLVKDLRGAHAPWPTQWTGWAAFNVDAMSALGSTLPLALGLIALATFIVLFLFTGSVVVPLKALVLNLLSLTATFGAMVWVFQEGHLSQLLGFTASGYLVANMVVLMFCLAWGMSMDYEVFLLSRIREEWAASPQTHDDNTRAVAVGLARTGPIVTAAAALMAIVFASMVSSSVQFMKLFGLGLTLAVLADATLVRGILVPAFMRLMGRANWWAPRPLVWVHDRFGLREEAADV